MFEDDVYYMRLAIEEAQKAFALEEVPVGAVAVAASGEVVSSAHNLCISLNDPTAHAEMLALRQAARELGNYRLLGVTLFVTIEPCAMCAGACVLARIERLVYGAQDLKAGACQSLYQIVQDKRLNHQIQVTSGVLKEECRSLMQSFFRMKRLKMCL
ncbi:MAG: tRNA adenosine(34) deaminase TadA [Deltaproteobacteria bacterium]|nr:tRNA adenosine(34) deaminase TadA [Deltaproteobacteria bacterium]